MMAHQITLPRRPVSGEVDETEFSYRRYPSWSAYMELPALRSLFVVALDENSLSVKRKENCASCFRDYGRS